MDRWLKELLLVGVTRGARKVVLLKRRNASSSFSIYL